MLLGIHTPKEIVMNQKPSLVTPRTAAEMLQVSPATLRVWRCTARGPRYIKYAGGKCGAVRYPVAALEEYAGMELAIPESANLSRYKTARKKSERKNTSKKATHAPAHNPAPAQ